MISRKFYWVAVNAAIVLEQRLRDTEHRFYSTIDDLVSIKDAHGRWKTLNKVGQDLLGLKYNLYKFHLF